MERITTSLEIKTGFLLKKCHQRHLFSREGYKKRFFVLSPMSLQYFEATDENCRHKCKGRIFLALMKSVEILARCQQSELGGGWPEAGWHGLQVEWSEEAQGPAQTLVALASSEAERNAWAAAIAGQAVSRGAKLLPPLPPLAESPTNQRAGGQQQQQQQQQQAATAAGADSCRRQRSASGSVAVASGAGDLAVAVTNVAVVVAIHSFRPLKENQLRLEKGSRYTIVDDTNAKWWYVRSGSGSCGYVPANYVRRPDSLETFDWYFKKISRQRSEHILLEFGAKEGSFLVRDSISKKNSYTLSVLAKDISNRSDWRVHHYHIHTTEDKKFYLSEKHACPSVPELVYYHQHNAGGLIVRLRSPPALGQEAPAPAGLGLDELEVDPSELQLDQQPSGRGQFGEVFRGQLRGQQVAVKRMLDGNMAEDDLIEEARNMRNLNHPNLVQLFGVVTRSRPAMIVTDFMPHGALKDFMRSRRPQYLKPGRVPAMVDICHQVALAMQYLEERNYIHRDLASRNILVKGLLQLQGFLEVKVSDFGMARLLLDHEYDASAGSKFPVRWAAPEVFQCNRYSVKSDVWAFGVFMWEVFTACETPYQGRDNADVCRYVAEGGVLEKPLLCPEQQVYIYVMLECWRAASQQRPSFADIVGKFETVLEGMPR